MSDDERAIHDVLDAWWRATRENDVDTVLSLMADDVLFLTPGAEPFGKDEFESSSRDREVRVDGTSEIEELEVAGDWAWMCTRISVTMTPPDGEPSERGGRTLTILRRTPEGRWVLARDANLLPPP